MPRKGQHFAELARFQVWAADHGGFSQATALLPSTGGKATKLEAVP